MLIGSYTHSIDEKGRMIFPLKFREEMGPVMLVTRWRDGCLAVFTQDEFMKMYARMNEKSESEDEDITELARTLLSGTSELEPDKQGRVLIPAELRARAGISRDVVVAGLMNRVEIWDKARWESRSNQSDDSRFEQLMHKLRI